MSNVQYNYKGKPVVQDGKSSGKGLLMKCFLGAVAIVVLIGALLIMMHPKSAERAVPEEPPAPEGTAPVVPPPAETPKPVQPPAPYDNSKMEAAAKEYENAKGLMAAEKFAAARQSAWDAMKLCGDENSQLWKDCSELAGKTSILLFISDIPSPERVLHQVGKGDSLFKIANDNNTTIEAVQRANKMAETESTIFPGQTMAVYKGDWSIKVDKSDCTLTLYDAGRLFKRYTVGVGRQDRTPAGTFKIGDKIKEPPWYSKGKKYAYGSPENILGTRWMELEPTGGTNANLSGYGIHGTDEPNSLGKSSSNGCIRMKNEDVNELFSIIPMNTPVEIVE